VQLALQARVIGHRPSRQETATDGGHSGGRQQAWPGPSPQFRPLTVSRPSATARHPASGTAWRVSESRWSMSLSADRRLGLIQQTLAV
jgi:hypothetical protein